MSWVLEEILLGPAEASWLLEVMTRSPNLEALAGSWIGPREDDNAGWAHRFALHAAVQRCVAPTFHRARAALSTVARGAGRACVPYDIGAKPLSRRTIVAWAALGSAARKLRIGALASGASLDSLLTSVPVPARRRI